jgi:hypothetical protein
MASAMTGRVKEVAQILFPFVVQENGVLLAVVSNRQSWCLSPSSDACSAPRISQAGGVIEIIAKQHWYPHKPTLSFD